MEGGGAVELHGQGELGAEAVELGFDVGVFNPAVEADLTDHGAGVIYQKLP